MELSPEEKKRIYEEEKARIEAREQIEREKLRTPGTTSTGLSPNDAGLLCYVGGWISGIVFLVLEQKNSWVRFHAAQSIVVFAAITIGAVILGLIPIVGGVFSAMISIAGFILWIILMIKAHNGERYKLAWAGDIAERMVGPSVAGGEYEGPAPQEPAPAADAAWEKPGGPRAERHIISKRDARIAGSAFAVAWSIVLLILFNFFNQYIAFYSSETVGGTTIWTRQPFFTQDINLWLPILTATLVISALGHIILIIFDKYVLREVIHIVAGGFGLATVIVLLSVFPFDFSVMPNAAIADVAYTGVTIALICICIGIAVGILVRSIRLGANVTKGLTSYQEET